MGRIMPLFVLGALEEEGDRRNFSNKNRGGSGEKRISPIFNKLILKQNKKQNKPLKRTTDSISSKDWKRNTSKSRQR